jgi:RNA polymerase sigma factor (sigma-70 family)
VDEVRLAHAAAGGDGHAFATLYDAYERRIFTYCQRLVGSPEDAADATQEAFLRVLQRLPSLQDRELNFGAYLFTAARNASYDVIGRRKRAESVDEVPETGATPVLGDERAAVAEDPERAAMVGALQAQVQAAHARLPERQREVLVLREVEELSYDDIGEIMGMNRNAVAQLISRARIKLRGELRGDALASVAVSSVDCERALPLIAMSQDRQLRDEADAAWLEEHVAGCATCQVGIEAMQEAGIAYRAWAPILPFAWMFREAVARAAELTGSDWSDVERPGDRGAGAASGGGTTGAAGAGAVGAAGATPAGATLAGATPAGAATASAEGGEASPGERRRRGLAAVVGAALLLLLLVPLVGGDDDPADGPALAPEAAAGTAPRSDRGSASTPAPQTGTAEEVTAPAPVPLPAITTTVTTTTPSGRVVRRKVVRRPPPVPATPPSLPPSPSPDRGRPGSAGSGPGQGVQAPRPRPTPTSPAVTPPRPSTSSPVPTPPSLPPDPPAAADPPAPADPPADTTPPRPTTPSQGTTPTRTTTPNRPTAPAPPQRTAPAAPAAPTSTATTPRPPTSTATTPRPPTVTVTIPRLPTITVTVPTIPRVPTVTAPRPPQGDTGGD